METRRWTNPSQPQTLQVAVFLLYINAVFAVLFGGFFSPFGLFVIAGGVAGGYGIANERRWGYGLALAVALAPLVLLGAAIAYDGLGDVLRRVDLINLAFEIALVALLLHPRSRDYQRIWFS